MPARYATGVSISISAGSIISAVWPILLASTWDMSAIKWPNFRGKSPLLTAFINCRKGNPSISYMSCLWTVLSAISPIWTMYSLWSIKIRTISPLIKDRNWATSCMQMRIMTGIWMPTTGSRSVTATPPHLLSAVISVFPGKDSISVCCSKG